MKNNLMQEKVYEYIRDYKSIHGYSPTIREIGSAVGLKSTSSVYEYIKKLKKSGIIKNKAGQPRTLELGEQPQSHYFESVIEIGAEGRRVCTQKDVRFNFKCPVCGGTAWVWQSGQNGKYYVYCDGCGRGIVA